jgi:hypothetical protein
MHCIRLRVSFRSLAAFAVLCCWRRNRRLLDIPDPLLAVLWVDAITFFSSSSTFHRPACSTLSGDPIDEYHTAVIAHFSSFLAEPTISSIIPPMTPQMAPPIGPPIAAPIVAPTTAPTTGRLESFLVASALSTPHKASCT